MEGYFDHLCQVVRADETLHLDLAEWLYHQEFVWLMSNDINRADDGKDLRCGFTDAPRGECTVLEMLIGLSKQLMFMADGLIPREANTVAEWFSELVSNLGLWPLSDDIWEEDCKKAERFCQERIDRWMNREFDTDGFGGIFPLRSDPHEDQTKVEIWYQMNAYLNEILRENNR